MPVHPTNILAIDPGCNESALIEWDGTKIVRAEKLPNEDVLKALWALKDTCQYLHIEWITSYGMRVGREVFETCRWIGRFEQYWGSSTTRLVPRMEVKRWHTGRPSSKDADVSGALKEKYGEKGTKANPGLTYCLKADLWQAFALATYVTERGK